LIKKSFLDGQKKILERSRGKKKKIEKFTFQFFASHLAKEVFGTIQIEQKVYLNNMNTADWFNKRG